MDSSGDHRVGGFPRAARGGTGTDAAPVAEAVADLEITLVCEFCHQPIVLRAGPDGTTLSNAHDFLDVHGHCLPHPRQPVD